MSTAAFTHEWRPATAPGLPVLLLLHGTGGNEHDLLDLGAALLPGAARLSPRGQVLEHGMPRFFRRFAEGVFDLEDLAVRTEALGAWLGEAVAAYGVADRPLVAVGYSNGANIAASVLLRGAARLAGAVLLRPMLTHEPTVRPALDGTRVLAVSGALDRITPAASAARLATLLQEAGATVRHEILPGVQHGLVEADLQLAGAWLREGFAN